MPDGDDGDDDDDDDDNDAPGEWKLVLPHGQGFRMILISPGGDQAEAGAIECRRGVKVRR